MAPLRSAFKVQNARQKRFRALSNFVGIAAKMVDFHRLPVGFISPNGGYANAETSRDCFLSMV